MKRVYIRSLKICSSPANKNIPFKKKWSCMFSFQIMFNSKQRSNDFLRIGEPCRFFYLSFTPTLAVMCTEQTHLLVLFVTISLGSNRPALMDRHSWWAKQISSITSKQTARTKQTDNNKQMNEKQKQRLWMADKEVDICRERQTRGKLKVVEIHSRYEMNTWKSCSSNTVYTANVWARLDI